MASDVVTDHAFTVRRQDGLGPHPDDMICAIPTCGRPKYAHQSPVMSKFQPLVDRAAALDAKVSRTVSFLREERVSPREQTINLEAFAEMAGLVLDLAKAVRDR